MRKIPTLFLRTDDGRLTREPHPDCGWVFAGEGTATRKYDGTCVFLDHAGDWWARREVKPGKQPPRNFQPVQIDEVTGKTVGWEPIEQSSFAKFHAEAVEPVNELGALLGHGPTPGTYELIGPKINGNPEGAEVHRLESHANAEQMGGWDLTYDSLREHLTTWIAAEGIEGIVWHHPDGRMAKLKVHDFAREAEPSQASA